MKVQMWAIEKPIPYARNPRQIPQIAVDKVAVSIREFGFRQPIVVDEKGVIVVGHARLLGAHKLGLTEVPVHVAAGLTVAQVKAYRLADNRTNQEAFWDTDALALELADLRVDEFDLDLTGFNLDEIQELLLEKTEGLTDEDDAPAVLQARLPSGAICGDLPVTASVS